MWWPPCGVVARRSRCADRSDWVQRISRDDPPAKSEDAALTTHANDWMLHGIRPLGHPGGPSTGRVHMAVTITDVARAAGVSASTVSRALSVPEKVDPTTRERVLRVAEHLG